MVVPHLNDPHESDIIGPKRPRVNLEFVLSRSNDGLMNRDNYTVCLIESATMRHK